LPGQVAGDHERRRLLFHYVLDLLAARQTQLGDILGREQALLSVLFPKLVGFVFFSKVEGPVRNGDACGPLERLPRLAKARSGSEVVGERECGVGVPEAEKRANERRGKLLEDAVRGRLARRWCG
jgi:hypothetical protein